MEGFNIIVLLLSVGYFAFSGLALIISYFSPKKYSSNFWYKLARVLFFLNIFPFIFLLSGNYYSYRGIYLWPTLYTLFVLSFAIANYKKSKILFSLLLLPLYSCLLWFYGCINNINEYELVDGYELRSNNISRLFINSTLTNNRYIIHPRFFLFEKHRDTHREFYHDESIIKYKENHYLTYGIDPYGLEISLNLLDNDFDYDNDNNFYDGLAKVYKGVNFGYIDTLGNLVIPIEYNFFDMNYHRDGLTILKKNNKYGILDMQGEVIHPFTLDTFFDPWQSENYIVLGKNNLKGAFSRKDKIIKCDYEEVKIDGSFLLASKNKKYGIINMSNQIVFPFTIDSFPDLNIYDTARYYIIQRDTLFMGAVSKKDFSIIIPEIYTHLTEKKGFFIATLMGKKGIINKENKTLVPLIYDEIKILNDSSLVICSLNGRESLKTINHKTIIPFGEVEEMYEEHIPSYKEIPENYFKISPFYYLVIKEVGKDYYRYLTKEEFEVYNKKRK